PMKENVTLDRTTVLQLDSAGTDGALNAAADCHVLRNDVALDLCAIAAQEIRGPPPAFDSADDLRWTIPFPVANDRGQSRRLCPPCLDLKRQAPLLGSLQLVHATGQISYLLHPSTRKDAFQRHQERAEPTHDSETADCRSRSNK